MSIIQITDLSFTYEGSFDPVFEHLTCRLDTDWRLGLVGRNGRGKTTFLKLLLGAYPYSGSITADAAFAYFPSQPADPALPALEAVLPALDGAPEWMLLRETSLLGLSEEALARPFATLSGGEQTKLLLAALFCREDGFPLIDEPTNHLDLEGRALVARYLSRKRGFLLVSHDRAFLDASIDHVFSLDRSGITLQKGNFTTWQENKDLQDQFELAQNERLKKDIGRLSAAARRTSGWSDRVEASKFGDHAPDRGFIGHKSAKMMKRAKAIEKRREDAVTEKSALLKNIERADALALQPLSYHQKTLIEVSGLSIAYDRTHPVCRDVSFSIGRGERIALRGPNGSGKSSILKLLAGQEIPHTGALTMGNGLVISYVSQETGHLRGDLRAFAQANGLDESLFKSILRKLDFARVQFEKPMESYSGGQKKKVLLAASLCRPAHLYLWDEPLNFIDVLSRMQIESLLLASQPTLLFVEHDQMFCDTVATRVIDL